MKTRNFLKSTFSLGISFLVTPLAYGQGQGVGNGGDAVVCADLKTHKKIAFVLDYFEAANESVLHLDLNVRTRGLTQKEIVERKIEKVLSRVERLEPIRAQRYRKHYVLLKQSRAFLSDVAEIIDIQDSELKWIKLKKNCELVQAAMQVREPEPLESKFKFDSTVFEEMDADNQAGLILHEIGYLDQILVQPGIYESKPVRALNAFFASREADTMKVDAYRVLVAKIFEGSGYLTDFLPGVHLSHVNVTNPSPYSEEAIFSAEVEVKKEVALTIGGQKFFLSPSIPTAIRIDGRGNVLSLFYSTSRELLYSIYGGQDLVLKRDYSERFGQSTPKVVLPTLNLQVTGGRIQTEEGGDRLEINFYEEGQIENLRIRMEDYNQKERVVGEFLVSNLSEKNSFSGTFLCRSDLEFGRDGTLKKCGLAEVSPGTKLRIGSNFYIPEQVGVSGLERPEGGAFTLTHYFRKYDPNFFEVEREKIMLVANQPNYNLGCGVYVENEIAETHFGGGGYFLVKKRKQADFILSFEVGAPYYSYQRHGTYKNIQLTHVKTGFAMRVADFDTRSLGVEYSAKNQEILIKRQAARTSTEYGRLTNQLDPRSDKQYGDLTPIDIIFQTVRPCVSILK